MTPTHDHDQIGQPVASSIREALAGLKPDRTLKFDLFTADLPAIKYAPTHAEAMQLSIDIRRMRDQINKLLQKYYHWPEVMNLSVHKQLQCLMGIALQYTSRQYDDWTDSERRMMADEPNADKPVVFHEGGTV